MKKLLNYGKENLIFLIIQSIFLFLPFLITFFLIRDILNYINQEKRVFVGITLLLIQIVYLVFFEKNISYKWSENAKKDIVNEYLRKLIKLENINESRIIQSHLRAIEYMDRFYQVFFPELLKVIIGYIVLITLSIYTKTLIFVLPILTLLIIIFGMKWLLSNSNSTNRRYMASFMALGNRFLDNLQGLNTLIMYNVDENYQRDFEKSSEEFRIKTMELLSYQLKSLFIITIAIFSSMILSNILLRGNVLEIKIATQIYLFLYLLNFRPAGYFYHIVKASKPSIDSIFEVIERENTEINFEESEKIIINNLSLNFEKRQLFDNASYTFEKGRLYGIFAKNGTGKSTLAKVLSKSISNYSGEIKSPKSIGYLTENSYLFDMSIEENILIENKFENWKEILSENNLLEFVSNYALKIGENGNLLSPGQRQQVAFARMILSNKDVYIFDECASSVDEKNRFAIIEYIKKISREKIVILITHDIDEINQVDEIVYIKEKKLVGAKYDN